MTDIPAHLMKRATDARRRAAGLPAETVRTVQTATSNILERNSGTVTRLYVTPNLQELVDRINAEEQRGLSVRHISLAGTYHIVVYEVN